MPTTTVAAIDRQLDFRASPERLWRALTDGGELASWFGQRAQLDLRAGGDGWLEFEGYGRVPVRIDVFEPVTRLSWRWGDAGKTVDEGSTLVEFRLEPLAGGGTRLHLRESGFEREDSRWSNTEGWVTELAELAKHVAVEPFEAGIRRTYALTSPLDRVWRAFSEPAELGAWWAGTPDLEIRAGYEGWFVWPSEGGRFAMRFEAVEPPATCAGPGRPYRRSRSPRPRPCSGPSGPSSPARTEGPTSTCSKAASPNRPASA